MSYEEKPEFQALQQLEATVNQVTEELASWRRRAKAAEAVNGDGEDDQDGNRELKLEGENEELRERLDHVRERIVDLLARLRFLEEQTLSTDGR